jgi:hypothetical protein
VGCNFPNEAVRGTGVDEGDEIRCADLDRKLKRVAAGNAGDYVQGEYRSFLGCLGLNELDPIDVEDATADAVVSSGVGLVTVVT